MEEYDPGFPEALGQSPETVDLLYDPWSSPDTARGLINNTDQNGPKRLFGLPSRTNETFIKDNFPRFERLASTESINLRYAESPIKRKESDAETAKSTWPVLDRNRTLTATSETVVPRQRSAETVAIQTDDFLRPDMPERPSVMKRTRLPVPKTRHRSNKHWASRASVLTNELSDVKDNNETIRNGNSGFTPTDFGVQEVGRQTTAKAILDRLARRYSRHYMDEESEVSEETGVSQQTQHTIAERKLVLKRTNKALENAPISDRSPTVGHKKYAAYIGQHKPVLKPLPHHGKPFNTIRTYSERFKQLRGGSKPHVENWVMNVNGYQSHGRNVAKATRSGWGRRDVVRKRHRRRRYLNKYPVVLNQAFYIRQKHTKQFYNVRKKSIQSDIPFLYSDAEEDLFPAPRPLTDNAQNRYGQYGRYVQDNEPVGRNYRGPAHKKIGKSGGALVWFYRNGDPGPKIPITINRRNFRNLDTLLVTLTDKFSTPTGVRHIFKLPEGREIFSITDFQNRCEYVASSTKVLKPAKYGDNQDMFWSNKKPSAGKTRKTDLKMYAKAQSPKGSPPVSTPTVVTMTSNLSRDRQERVLLNPQTQQTFEEWLSDIYINDQPVLALYTAKPPYTQVVSFSQLNRELETQCHFIACGDEFLPLELMKKRQAPSSNSSSDSIGDRGRKKKLPRQQEMGQIHEYGRPVSPTSTSMSRYDGGPMRGQGGYGQKGKPSYGKPVFKETVEKEIDGVIREFVPPSFDDPDDDGRKPDVAMRMEWVYGFRGKDARHNLTVLPRTGEVLYFVSSVVVLHDTFKDTQRIYNKHNEEITCMTLHPDGIQVATGQLQGKEPDHAAHIRIWHGEKLSTKAIIGVSAFEAGIISIGFSYDSVYMCALDGSDKHVLSVWDWEHERMVAKTTTTTDAVHCACFYPDGEDNNIIITFGAGHIYFWKIFFHESRKREAKILRDRKSGVFEPISIPRSVNCIGFLINGDVVTGDSSGNLMVWERDAEDAFLCKQVVNASKYPVTSVCVLGDGTLLSGSGREEPRGERGRDRDAREVASEILAWDAGQDLTLVKTRQIPLEAGTIRVIVPQTAGGMDGKVYIGTAKSCVLEGSLQSKFRYVVQGHSDSIWGLISHQSEPTFFTAGMDGMVFKWSLITHKPLWRIKVQTPCTCAALDPRNEMIALGTKQGSFIVLRAHDGKRENTIPVMLQQSSDSDSPDDPEIVINCIAYLPTSSPYPPLVALGCSDGLIHIFSVHDKGTIFKKRKAPLRGHTTGVVNIDWSNDGRCLQSVGEDYELLFWDVDTREPINVPRVMRDVEWATNTCCVSYSLIGPWSHLEKGQVLKAVSRSSYRDLVITGDNLGNLRLFKYPCSREKAEFRGVKIYSSEVTSLAFSLENSTALSCGGYDSGLVQWSLQDSQ